MSVTNAIKRTKYDKIWSFTCGNIQVLISVITFKEWQEFERANVACFTTQTGNLVNTNFYYKHTYFIHELVVGRDRGFHPSGLTRWLLWQTTTTTAASQPCPFFFSIRRPTLPVRALSEDLCPLSAAQDPHGRPHGRARLPLLRVRLVVRISLDPDRSPETKTSDGESCALHLTPF